MKNRRMKQAGATIFAAFLAGNLLTAYAADTTNITIEGTAGSYKAYRLLDLSTQLKEGDTHAGTAEDPHSDGCYAYHYTVNSTYASALEAAGITKSGEELTDEEVTTYLEGIKDDVDAVRAFTDAVYVQVKDLDADETAKDKVFTDVPLGYYLIVESETDSTKSDDTVSLVMLDTGGAEDITVKSKEGVPTLTKKIVTSNETLVETVSAAKDDVINYRLTTTMPDKISYYETYPVTFTDTADAGLTIQVTDASDVTVKIDGTTLTGGYSASVDGQVLTVTIDDVKASAEVTADSVVTVEYSAVLNSSATMGTSGNENTATLTFRNDPYDTSDADKTGVTPEDQADVYSFNLLVHKKDTNGNALEGAEFTLYRKGESDDWSDAGTITVEDGATTDFTFNHLSEGTYKLVESKVPAGYNQADDVTFTVTAEYTGEDEKSVQALTKIDVADTDNDEATTTPVQVTDLEKGQMEVTIKNTTGIILPSTGGTGALLLVAGGTGAIVLFILTGKKKTKENESF